jgi:hypothetical protein
MTSDQQQAVPNSTVARIGRWEIPWMPDGWQFLPDFGIRKIVDNGVSSNIAINEDILLVGDKLFLYVDTQISIMRQTFHEPTIAGPRPAEFAGADEAMLLMIKHESLGGATVIQVQNYLRCEKWIGIITLTTLEHELLKVRSDFERFSRGLKIGAPLETA